MKRFPPAARTTLLLAGALLLLAPSVLLVSAPAAAQGERFTLEARDVDLADVIRLLGARSGQNVVADGSVKPQRVTLRLKDVTFDEALAALLTAYGLQTHRDGRIVFVGDVAAMNRRYPTTAGRRYADRGVRAAHARRRLVAALQRALQGRVVVGDKNGALVVTGGAATLAGATARRALDAPVKRWRSVATESIPLRNLRASDAVKALRGWSPTAPCSRRIAATPWSSAGVPRFTRPCARCCAISTRRGGK